MDEKAAKNNYLNENTGSTTILHESNVNEDNSLHAPELNAASTSVVNEQPKSTNSKKRLTMVLIVAGVILAAFAIFIGLNLNSSKPLERMSAAELLELGEKYLLEMNYEQAIVVFNRLIEIEPMNARAYIGAAEAYLALGQQDNAIEVLRRGLEVLPDEPTIQAMIKELTEPEPEPESEPESESESEPQPEPEPEPEPETLTNMQRFLRGLMAAYEAGGTESIYTAVETDDFKALMEQVTEYPVIYIDDTGSRGVVLYSSFIYIGDYVNNERSGYGAWIYYVSSMSRHTYVGEWANDLPNGHGTAYYEVQPEGKGHWATGSGFLIDGLWDGRLLYRSSRSDVEFYIYYSNGEHIRREGRFSWYVGHAVNDESYTISGRPGGSGAPGFGYFY